MDEIKVVPNSNKYKESQKEAAAKKEEREIKKVITNGSVKTKKKTGLRKLTESVVSENASEVKGYLLSDVLIPALKKLVFDIISDGSSMFLFGKSSRAGGGRHSGSYISYTSYSNKDREQGRYSTATRTRFNYDELIFPSRGEAEAVLMQMEDVIARYGFVTVCDLYDMVDLTAPYTSQKYGWTNIRNAEAVRTFDGYVLKLPKATLID